MVDVARNTEGVARTGDLFFLLDPDPDRDHGGLIAVLYNPKVHCRLPGLWVAKRVGPKTAGRPSVGKRVHVQSSPSPPPSSSSAAPSLTQSSVGKRMRVGRSPPPCTAGGEHSPTRMHSESSSPELSQKCPACGNYGDQDLGTCTCTLCSVCLLPQGSAQHRHTPPL
jgi:hypothetical protein